MLSLITGMSTPPTNTEADPIVFFVTWACLTGVFLAAFFIIRNHYTLKMRHTLLRAAYVKAKKAEAEGDQEWIRYFQWFGSLPSYNQMFFMIAVWSPNEWLKTIPE